MWTWKTDGGLPNLLIIPDLQHPPLKETIKMWQIMEENCMAICTEGAVELIKASHQYRAHLPKMSREGGKQTTLDDFFSL